MTMRIKVLGPGCAACDRLFEATRRAVEEIGLDALVELSHDMPEMLRYGAMFPPALVVDGKVVLEGRVLASGHLREFLTRLASGADRASALGR